MSGLPPLKSVARSAVTRELIESAKDDAPGPDARARALASLGLGASTIAAAKVGTTGAGAAKTAVGSLVAKVAATVTAVAAKGGVTALVIGLGLVAGGTALGVHHRTTAPTSVQRAATTAPPPADVRTQPSSATTEPLPSQLPTTAAPGSGDAMRSASPTPRRATQKVVVASTKPSSTGTSSTSSESVPTPSRLTAQLALLNRIRAALHAHEPVRALGMLDELERDDPSSTLAEEIMVLRVDALAAAGRPTEAGVLGRTFLERHPNSAYAERVRTKLKVL